MGLLSCLVRCFEPPLSVHGSPSSRARAAMVKLFGKHTIEPNPPSSSLSTVTSIMTDSYNDGDVDPNKFPTAMYAGDDDLIPNISIVSQKTIEPEPPSRYSDDIEISPRLKLQRPYVPRTIPRNGVLRLQGAHDVRKP